MLAQYSEFELISKYFANAPLARGLKDSDSFAGSAIHGSAIQLGIGDDCALVHFPSATNLATSTDILIENRHFFTDVDPVALGYKALAVNISDLAAMGAQPVGCLLGLSLTQEKAKDAWLEPFSRGFFQAVNEYGCPLIGGDTTAGEQLMISVTVLGSLPANSALTRSGAQVGDDIWVSGELGKAHIALQLLFKQSQFNQNLSPVETELLAQIRPALELPKARLYLGLALRGVAHSAIDISDGLSQDLGHILTASKVGAILDWNALERPSVLAYLSDDEWQNAALNGGDVYELCFTASPDQRTNIQALGAKLNLALRNIGVTVEKKGLWLRCNDQLSEITPAGFDHFK